MILHEKEHPLAGKTVVIKEGVTDPLQGQVVAGAHYVIEDWADRLMGDSVWEVGGNPAIFQYAYRQGMQDHGGFPGDDECVYGKIDYGPNRIRLGHIVHVSEFEEMQ